MIFSDLQSRADALRLFQLEGRALEFVQTLPHPVSASLLELLQRVVWPLGGQNLPAGYTGIWFN
jgi:hypothetical protein